MCRSGDRSAGAANLMIKAGYKNVYSIADGFEGDIAKDGAHKGERAVNGWKNAGLPWTYKMNKKVMYLD
jgi:rhodanese-related sulfurtransferase